MSGIEKYDQVEHFWCPMLGQTIRFSYCRTMASGLPCHRVATCFSSHFDVASFLEENYSVEERSQFLAPPAGRLARVLDALEKATADKDEGQK